MMSGSAFDVNTCKILDGVIYNRRLLRLISIEVKIRFYKNAIKKKKTTYVGVDTYTGSYYVIISKKKKTILPT